MQDAHRRGFDEVKPTRRAVSHVVGMSSSLKPPSPWFGAATRPSPTRSDAGSRAAPDRGVEVAPRERFVDDHHLLTATAVPRPLHRKVHRSIGRNARWSATRWKVQWSWKKRGVEAPRDLGLAEPQCARRGGHPPWASPAWNVSLNGGRSRDDEENTTLPGRAGRSRQQREQRKPIPCRSPHSSTFRPA